MLIARIALALGFLVAMLPSCAWAQQSAVPDKYVLQWSEDFKGTVLDASKWNYRTDVKLYSAQTPANISLDGAGHMNITLRQEDFAGKHFTGGGIISKAAFRYGYYEAEAKTSNYPGWHTAFWMYAGDGRTIPPRYPAVSNSTTELDDMEIEDPNFISMGYLEWQHGKNDGDTRCDAKYAPGFDTSAAYHTYGLEWTEQEIKYYFDGKLICTQQYPPTQHPHDLLNIWLTSMGHWPNIAVPDRPSPASFGRVAYYVRDYYMRNTEPGYAEYGDDWVDGELPGYSSLGTRASCNPSDFAVWTPTILAAGTYDVQEYRTPGPKTDGSARLIVHSRDASKTVDVPVGAEGWVDLGTYDFAQGSSGSVTIVQATAGANTPLDRVIYQGSSPVNKVHAGHGCTYADIVKFVRQ